MKAFNSTNNECLKTKCNNVEECLRHGMQCDIDGKDLFRELEVLKGLLPTGVKGPIEVLNHLKLMDGCFPCPFPLFIDLIFFYLFIIIIIIIIILLLLLLLLLLLSF